MPHGSPHRGLGERKRADCIAFLERSLAFFARHGVAVERVTTNNGSAYRSYAFRDVLKDAGLRRIRTRPYTQRTNGKAERFIPPSPREWADANAYTASAARIRAMQPFLTTYNTARPHSSLADQTPWLWLNNLLGNDS